ncbi:Choline/Carnitine o-acyltransferase family protein [Candida albicans]|uniref:Choline/Carnitine o-acyltransferase family protein n=1 Tax=Candida albicans TaxID=5476 RepID=A0A8H6BZM0_CANAX|nr:Choline/Carnitine o-acyltransferase family protein [Candida albicans]
MKEKLQYLSDACKKHSEKTRMSSMGQGVDRYLYAMFCIWKRYLQDYEEEQQQQQHPVEEGSGGEQQMEAVGLSRDDTIVVQMDGEHDDDDSTTVVGTNGGKNLHASGSHGNNDIYDNFDLLKTVPELFADSGWDKLNSTIISTSNCGNPSLRLFGFGPVSANGFGIGYILKDDSISICASSKHRQTQRFLVTLNSYLLEIQSIWKQVETMNKLQDELALKIDISKKQKETEEEQARPKHNINALLGGYGYFDMGEEDIKSRGQSPEPPFLNRANSSFSVREIGKNYD